MLDISAVPKYEKPAALIRNRVMTRAEFGLLLRHSDRNFRRFLIALRLTGCRPGELSSLIWDWVDLDEGMWILPDHKTITRQREPMPRMIPLSATVLSMCRWLARKPHSGSDHVFLNKLGFPYSKDCLVRKMARLRQRANLGIKGGEKAVLYNIRTGFATESAGKVSDIELAALMGHTEVRMTQRYYKASVARLRDIRHRLEARSGVRENASASGNDRSRVGEGVSACDSRPATLPTPVPQEGPTQAVS
jgi:integrase